MSLTLYTNVSGTITQLNDGNPFKLESAEGLSGSDVIRYEQGGPFQNGATDLGFRFQPRTMTLSLLFYASTATLLDTYRATLMAAFKPFDSTSIFLSVSRDDSEIRVLTCFTVGDIGIELVPESYPGHLHRATVQLRAATPLWRANDVTLGTAALGGWPLAGGSIAIANLKAYTEYPAQGLNQVWAGTITGDWSVVVLTQKDTTGPGTARYAWQDGTSGSASFWKTTAGSYAIHDTDGGTAWPGTTDYNYHVVESRSGTQVWSYWNGTSLTSYRSIATDVSLRGGSNYTWRGTRIGGLNWSPELKKAAVYGTVSTAQLNALGPYIMGTASATITLVNDGDVYAYPLITLYGPISDPVIVNSTVGGTLDLTGVVVGTAATMTIDLRDGNKRIYNQSGSNWLGSATTLPLSLASFALAPAPIASGGTNTLTITYSYIGSAAYIVGQITNQYMSF